MCCCRGAAPSSRGRPRASRPAHRTRARRVRTSSPSASVWCNSDDVIRVEGRLTENDPAKLQFGKEVELTMVPFTTDEDGNEIVTFAFQPV